MHIKLLQNGKKTGGAAAARAGHVEGRRNHRPWDDQHHSESCVISVPPLATLAFPIRPWDPLRTPGQ
jgi:hypothetical protein